MDSGLSDSQATLKVSASRMYRVSCLFFEAEKGNVGGTFRLGLGNHCHRFGMCLVIIVIRGISGQSIRRPFRALSCDLNLSAYRMPENI